MKELILALWALWDWIYFHCNRMQFVSKEDNLFRVVRKTYKGLPLKTDDGTVIFPGDEIIKIHLYNYRIAQDIKRFPSELAYIYHFKRALLSSLQGLCAHILTLPNHDRIKGIMGTTMLNRGADRLGFTLCEVRPTCLSRAKDLLFKLIFLLIHPQGRQYLRQHGHKLKSKHVVMSLTTLKERYSN